MIHLPSNVEVLRTSRRLAIIHLGIGLLFSTVGIFVVRAVLAKGAPSTFIWLWGSIWFLGSGTALYSGLTGLISPRVFAIFDREGVEFRSARIRRIPWSDLSGARESLRTVTRGNETHISLRAPITLSVRDPGLMKGVWKGFKFTHAGSVMPDGTAEILLKTEDCPLTNIELIQKLSQRIGVVANLRPADPKTETLGGTMLNHPGKRGYMVYFAPCVFLFFGLTFAGIGVHKLKQAHASRTWLSARATITAFSIEKTTSTNSKGPGSISYIPHVKYRFQVGNQTFTSDRATFLQEHSLSNVQEFRRRFPVGAEVTAYYDPQNPSDAVLTREKSNLIWIFAGFGSLFAIIGGWLLIRLLSARNGN